MNVVIRYALLCIALLSAPGCHEAASTTDGGAGEDRKLVLDSPAGQDVGLRPGAHAPLAVRYVDAAGQGIPGAEIHFAIFGDPRGSTLSVDRASTTADGRAQIQVQAGAVASRFQVRATADQAEDVLFFIEVSDAGFGALRLTGSYTGQLAPDQLGQLTPLVYHLYSDLGCDSIDPRDAPPALRTRQASKLTTPTLFDSLPLDQHHTVLLLGLRPLGSAAQPAGWQPRIAGCTEIPPGTLKPCADGNDCPPADQMDLSLAVDDLWPTFAQGGYQVQSVIRLPRATRPVANALKPWATLSDCPLDPEQRLLDCVLDALDGADPLDCVVQQPSPATQALLEVRGTLAGPCREATTTSGAPSLESLLRAGALSTAAGQRAALATVEASAAPLLTELVLQSTLTVTALTTDAPLAGTISGRHQLTALVFESAATGKSATYAAPALGLASWSAPIRGSTQPQVGAAWGWQTTIEPHQLSLRYGLVARLALGKLVLAPAGLEPDSLQLAQSLVNAYHDGSADGCSALDALACRAARLAPGCLTAACPQGLQALASDLDRGFQALDGPGSTIDLSGTVVMEDSDGDMLLEVMGQQGALGSWQATLQMGDEQVAAEQASFHGQP